MSINNSLCLLYSDLYIVSPAKHHVAAEGVVFETSDDSTGRHVHFYIRPAGEGNQRYAVVVRKRRSHSAGGSVDPDDGAASGMIKAHRYLHSRIVEPATVTDIEHAIFFADPA